MATTAEKIKKDLKEAMIARDESKVPTLRMLISSIRNKEIEVKEREGLSEDKTQAVLRSEIKKRKDSILAFDQGGRSDLSDKEKAEISVIESYLPEQMGEDEVRKVAEEIFSKSKEAGTVSFGSVMGQVMGRLKGKADGALVTKIVKEILNDK